MIMKLIQKIFDVIIIGAGPAGLMAARALHAKGIDYLIIDSKKRLGYPLKCAEGIPESDFKRFFGSANRAFVRNHVKNHAVIYEDYSRTIPLNYLQLDRPIFERWLGRGLNMLLDTRFIDMHYEGDYAALTTSRGIIKARLVILCNGSNFHLQKKLGLAIKNPTIAIGYGGLFSGYSCSGYAGKLRMDTFYYFFDPEFDGYLWVFPKSARTANIGVAYCLRSNSQQRTDPRHVLRALMEKNKIIGKMLKEYSGTIPCSGPIKKTYADRLLVCGDAAGLVYAGTGEGIKYALLSGELAGKLASDAVHSGRFDSMFLKQYETSWKRSFSDEMVAGMAFLDMTIAASRIRKTKSLFMRPTDKEILGLICGRLPLRAWIGWKIIRIIGLNKI